MPVKIIGPGFSVSATGKNKSQRAREMVDEIVKSQEEERAANKEVTVNPHQAPSRD